ncbi:holin [Streptomyces sp. Je 1-369]|uniref:holin n=1 Tax=Streptomyces sp. Je 1-369 TaxID=2966192 RepID=UPI0022863633|nr:holin [Streptomyces sp. Je 1-369]WAL94009.1 holin [Streptomyces sp. Je 1-369]
MNTLAFWKATAERMIRTMAQGTLGAVSADALGILDVDWGEAFSVGGLAAALALLTAIGSSGGPVGPGRAETVATPDTPRRPTSI